MAKANHLATVRVNLLEACEQLKTTFVERDEAVDCIAIALITGQNFILVGEPGTAKTKLVQAAFSHIESARTFSTLLGPYVTEDKLFGPVDIQSLKGTDSGGRSKWQRVLDGRLADCDLGMLDEILKASEGTLNSMLGALNERVYDGQPIVMHCCGSATNWPEVRRKGANIEALWDRLLLRCPVSAVRDRDKRAQLLAQSEKVAAYSPRARVSLDDLKAVKAHLGAIEIKPGLRLALVEVAERLAKINTHVSDRRLAQVQAVLRASAWLAGRESVDLDDFKSLSFCTWDESAERFKASAAIMDTLDQDTIRHVVQQLQAAVRQCVGATTADQAPRMCKVAAEVANKINEYVEQHAIGRKGWEANVKPEVAKLRTEQSRLTKLMGKYVGTEKGANQ